VVHSAGPEKRVTTNTDRIEMVTRRLACAGAG
jgi:hypothetical protein